MGVVLINLGFVGSKKRLKVQLDLIRNLANWDPWVLAIQAAWDLANWDPWVFAKQAAWDLANWDFWICFIQAAWDLANWDP